MSDGLRRAAPTAVGLLLLVAAVGGHAAARARAPGKVALYASVGPILARYDVDVEHAALTKRESIGVPANVQYAWLHPSGRHLYVVWSGGADGSRHGVNAFDVEPGSGSLRAHGPVVPLKYRPIHVTTDRDGAHLLIAYNQPPLVSVHDLAPDGTIATVAGTGTAGFAGDLGLATNARLNSPNGLAFDGAGNMYVADAGNGRIRKITRDGIISSITQVISVTSVTVDTAGTVYVGGTNVIYKVAAGATTATVFGGDPNTKAFSGDGGPAANARFQDQQYVAVDRSGSNLFIADSGNARVRKVGTDGIIRTIAGNGKYRYSGEGGAALTSPLSLPFGLAVDAEGAIYFSERDGHRVRKVKTGILTTVAGIGTPGFSGDGGPANAAQINGPQGLVFDTAGNLYIADSGFRYIAGLDPVDKRIA
jgi:6-phosphogluconolactonase (cycloisomerase 2 family)